MNPGAEGSAVPWITLVAAVIAAVVGIIGALLQRRTGRETSRAAARSADAAEESAYAATVSAEAADQRAKREEVMRIMRWAAELAISEDMGRAELGVAQLTALYDSPLLDEELLPQVDAALRAVVSSSADEIEEIEGGGQTAEVVEVAGDESGPSDAGRGDLSSEEEKHARAGRANDGEE
ncbi:MAG TPA: hypothetical protein VFG72_11230 [Marmoricola sp.]|nr:hypothetical protein [Marmoricola sp.]